MKKRLIPCLILFSLSALLLILAAAFALGKAGFEEPPLYTYSLIRTEGMKEEGQYATTRLSGYYSFLNVEMNEGENTVNYYYCFGEDADTGALFLFSAEEAALKAMDSTLSLNQPFRMVGILHPLSDIACDNTSVYSYAAEAAPAAGISLDEAGFSFVFGRSYLRVGEEPQPPARPVTTLLIIGLAAAAAGAALLLIGRKKN